ncbi:MAG: 2'-5' RNA ligase family protein [Anaerolineae bacterium]
MASKSYDRVRYVVIVRLPREIEVRIEDAYLTLTGATKPTMGYHVSLLGPFFLRENMGVGTLSGIEQVCDKWRPFPVHISGLGSFRAHDNNAIYLDVLAPQELITLHHELTQATSGQIIPQMAWYGDFPAAPFRPHVTLGLGLSDSALEECLRSGATRFFEATFQVECLYLVEQWPNHPWQVVREYTLGTAVTVPEADSTLG